MRAILQFCGSNFVTGGNTYQELVNDVRLSLSTIVRLPRGNLCFLCRFPATQANPPPPPPPSSEDAPVVPTSAPAAAPSYRVVRVYSEESFLLLRETLQRQNLVTGACGAAASSGSSFTPPNSHLSQHQQPPPQPSSSSSRRPRVAPILPILELDMDPSSCSDTMSKPASSRTTPVPPPLSISLTEAQRTAADHHEHPNPNNSNNNTNKPAKTAAAGEGAVDHSEEEAQLNSPLPHAPLSCGTPNQQQQGEGLLPRVPYGCRTIRAANNGMEREEPVAYREPSNQIHHGLSSDVVDAMPLSSDAKRGLEVKSYAEYVHYLQDMENQRMIHGSPSTATSTHRQTHRPACHHSTPPTAAATVAPTASSTLIGGAGEVAAPAAEEAIGGGAAFPMNLSLGALSSKGGTRTGLFGSSSTGGAAKTPLFNKNAPLLSAEENKMLNDLLEASDIPSGAASTTNPHAKRNANTNTAENGSVQVPPAAVAAAGRAPGYPYRIRPRSSAPAFSSVHVVAAGNHSTAHAYSHSTMQYSGIHQRSTAGCGGKWGAGLKGAAVQRPYSAVPREEMRSRSRSANEEYRTIFDRPAVSSVYEKILAQTAEEEIEVPLPPSLGG